MNQGDFMNNQIPYLIPINLNNPNINIDHLINKLNLLEKDVKILENRLNKLENIKEANNDNYDPKDLYII